jgi:GNAT superfamily N-acetyltransferase
MPIIQTVSGRAELKKFIEYPYQKFKNHPTWIPPLLLQEWEDYTPAKNPYFEHAEVEFFLALEGTRVVGRIAAVQDRSYNTHRDENVALFACFEADSSSIAKQLLETVEHWAVARGLSAVRGPGKIASNDMAGLLVDNFDDPPVVMMPYNPPEYPKYLEAAGYAKSEDCFAWHMTVEGGLPDRVARIAERVKKNLKVTLRPIALQSAKALEPELPIIREIYNAAWGANWSFVPWTEHEIEHLAAQLRQVADKALCLIAEVEGKPVAFSITLPDINESLRGTGGRLLPFGIIKLLMHKPSRMRLVALGIKPEYHGRGLDALLYAETFWRGKGTYSSGEFGWTLESNEAITQGMKALGAVPYKRYRVFEKRLAGQSDPPDSRGTGY